MTVQRLYAAGSAVGELDAERSKKSGRLGNLPDMLATALAALVGALRALSPGSPERSLDSEYRDVK